MNRIGGAVCLIEVEKIRSEVEVDTFYAFLRLSLFFCSPGGTAGQRILCL